LPVFPLIPQMLLPGGQLPLPTKYRLFFGEPLYFEGNPDDPQFVADKVYLVREAVAHILRRGLAQRRSIFL
jgi:hypothetical protein